MPGRLRTTACTDDPALRRIRREFLEMPGLSLTVCQAARLCNVEPGRCEALLQCLVDEHLLARTEDGRYVNASVNAYSGAA
jgi:hypothetical protein